MGEINPPMNMVRIHPHPKSIFSQKPTSFSFSFSNESRGLGTTGARSMEQPTHSRLMFPFNGYGKISSPNKNYKKKGIYPFPPFIDRLQGIPRCSN